MSLAQHVTASEGIDREVTGDDDDDDDSILNKGLWRPLSYNPLAPTDPLESPEQIAGPLPHIATYKISAARRLAQVVFGATLCCLASGIVFGFAALKPVLIAEGVYSELCKNTADDEKRLRPVPCSEQDMRLNLSFVSASVVANVSSLLAGYALDRYGRRACYIAAASFIAIGCAVLGHAFTIARFGGYILGNVIISLGGTFLFVPSFQLANAFPRYSGLVVSVITGSFDASAAVFLLYQLAWEATNGSFAPNQFFFAYIAVPVIMVIGEFTFMPHHAYQTTPDLAQKIEKVNDTTRDSRIPDAESDTASEIEDLLGDAHEREERAHKKEEIQLTSGVWGVLHGLPAHRQMATAWFILILLLTVVTMLKMNIFISTIRSQYSYLLQSEEEAEAITRFFGIALPLGGIAMTPFIGLLLDSLSVTVVIGMLTGLIAMVGILNCFPYVWAGYITVILFVIFRPFYYSAMCDYTTKVFGFATFGRLYGAITCLSGVFTFSQYGLDALVHGPFGGDPTPINAALAMAGTSIGLFLTIYVAVKSKSYQEVIQPNPHSPEEHMRLICEGGEGYRTMD
ncbi:amino acid transporter [Xylaria sp. CBS 124048]|nr:amino acid transporter [Xylaria sp. CBS 124048]